MTYQPKINLQERIDYMYIYIRRERERERERERVITFYGRDIENKMRRRRRVKIKYIVMTRTPKTDWYLGLMIKSYYQEWTS